MKVTLYVYWDSILGEADATTYKRNLSESYNSNLVLLRIEGIEIDDVEKPSDEFLRGKLVASLQGQKSTIQADAHMKIKAIDEKIQELLCLESK